MTTVKADFPKKLKFLFDDHRYKVARGGRGSGKSWSFARAILILGAQRPLRILCAREIQRSIKDSVHRLLADQIRLLQLKGIYSVLDTTIRGQNGTIIVFAGLSSSTIDTLKSYEGIDICWVEEGHTVSKRSWDILIPTIRKENSEIWVSYNPELETDDTHQRFTINKPPNCVNVEVNWRDNPWFSGTANSERLYCERYDPDNYAHIWEGQCLAAVEGAIYSKQMAEVELQQRICNVPYDPLLKVHVVVDLGWSDAMAIGMVQKHASEIRFIDYIEDTHKTLADYSKMLKKRDYNWGNIYFPHDGFTKGIKTGKTSAKIFELLGWRVVPKSEIVTMSVEEGIKNTRMLFNRFYFDRVKCERLIECLRRYRRAFHKKTGVMGSPLHDKYSHGADMTRYTAINVDHMTNETTHDDIDVNVDFVDSGTDWSW